MTSRSGVGSMSPANALDDAVTPSAIVVMQANVARKPERTTGTRLRARSRRIKDAFGSASLRGQLERSVAGRDGRDERALVVDREAERRAGEAVAAPHRAAVRAVARFWKLPARALRFARRAHAAALF